MAAAADETESLKAYLKEHRLEATLNGLLNQIVVDRPADPFAWMADQFVAHGGETVPTAEAFTQDVDGGRLTQQWDALHAFSAPGGSAAEAPAPARGAAPAGAAAPAAEAAAAGGGGETASSAKNAAKNAAKAEEKRKKEEEKERKRQEREAAQQKKLAGPEVPSLTILNFMEHPFGTLSIISEGVTGRTWTAVGDLAAPAAGTTVWLRARLANSRQQSAKLGFLVLRQRLRTVQLVVQGKDLCAFAAGLPTESVVDVQATVTVPPAPIDGCTQSAVELSVERIYAVSMAMPRLPLQVEDAARSEAEVEAKGLARVSQSVRLDNRVIDLRTAASQGIFRMQSQARTTHHAPRTTHHTPHTAHRTPHTAHHTACCAYWTLPALPRPPQPLTAPQQPRAAPPQPPAWPSQVCQLFREFLVGEGFIEIHSPKLVASASEGGADVFRLGYFDRYAYLAQSPQLYKQMALMADLGRVFEIGPVFRSEKSLTHRHMTEFVGLDMEMAFKVRLRLGLRASPFPCPGPWP